MKILRSILFFLSARSIQERSLQKPQRKGENYQPFFVMNTKHPVWSGAIYRFSRNLAGIRKSMFRWILSWRNLEFFPLRGRFSQKNDFSGASVNFEVNSLKTVRRRKTPITWSKAHRWYDLYRIASVRSSENISAASKSLETEGTPLCQSPPRARPGRPD